jgi:hypothetical protein
MSIAQTHPVRRQIGRPHKRNSHHRNRVQYASAGPQIERLENRAAADDEVMRPGYSLLQARHVAGERQRAHASLFMIARHFLLG